MLIRYLISLLRILCSNELDIGLLFAWYLPHAKNSSSFCILSVSLKYKFCNKNTDSSDHVVLNWLFLSDINSFCT